MKGDGANVDPKKKELSKLEYDFLKHLFDSRSTDKTAKGILDSVFIKQNDFLKDLDIRRVSSILSNLVGMDLLKSSDYKTMLTDEEIKKWETLDEPVYNIGSPGQPIYQRAEQVLKENGDLSCLVQMQWTGLNLFPLRQNKFEFKGIIRYFSESSDQRAGYLELNTSEEMFLQNSHIGKRVKIKLEIIE